MVIVAAMLASLALALFAFVLIRRDHGDPPTGWSAGPIIGGKNYSSGTLLVEHNGTAAFDIPEAPNGVHYVTRAGSLADKSQITMRYRLDLAPGASVRGVGNTGPSAVTPYFQRAGDDWSGAGEKEAYRWWATFASRPLAAGEHEIVAPLSGRWTAVETSNSIDSPRAFRDALENCARVGFTFANATGYGHGASAEGKAQFTLLAFDIA